MSTFLPDISGNSHYIQSIPFINVFDSINYMVIGNNYLICAIFRFGIEVLHMKPCVEHKQCQTNY